MKKLREIILEKIEDEKSKDKERSMAFLDEHRAAFKSTFGIEHDQIYYNDELERIVCKSGDMEVTACFQNASHSHVEWKTVHTCDVCGKKVLQEWSVSDIQYLQLDFPTFYHRHVDQAEELKAALRDFLGIPDIQGIPE